MSEAAGRQVHIHSDGHLHARAHNGRFGGVVPPGLSLLRMSLAGRIGLSGAFIALIWAAVYWAIG